jgi:hypothetical protein
MTSDGPLGGWQLGCYQGTDLSRKPETGESSVQKKWNGVLLTCGNVVRACAQQMTRKGEHSRVRDIDDTHSAESLVTNHEMKTITERLERSASHPKYDITIKPQSTRGR